jgi:hypothetical protein
MQRRTGGKGVGAIKNSDIVQSQEATSENIPTFFILAVDPPGEIDEKFLEAPF